MKIENQGELANPGLPGKWPLKWCVCVCVCVRDLHGEVDSGNLAGNPQEWVQLLQEYCGDGTETCRNTAGMEFIAVQNP